LLTAAAAVIPAASAQPTETASAQAWPQGLAFIILSVRDMAKTKAFYVDGLGLRITSPNAQRNPPFIAINGSGQPDLRETAIVLQQLDASGTKGPLGAASIVKGPVGIRVTNVDAVVAKLKSMGATIERPAFDSTEGDNMRKAFVLDPDGISVELLHPITPKDRGADK
jgi:catechol 2,3-dioxygenase-like lactoylglutathione lyase family enzyme